jgi:glycosyltransferase involved in cell wall biosynthesis
MSTHDAGGGVPAERCAASVVIPAHDEERTLGRLLDALCATPGQFEVVVACNGCTDGTVGVARRYPVTVLDLPEPSKTLALRAADRVAHTFPRVYLDADVEISAEGMARLAQAVARDGIHVAGPRRVLPRARVSWLARWYYDVWEALPHVRRGLFGRGVLALSADGVRRVRDLPDVLADDLAFAEAFAPAERVVVDDVTVLVYPARTWRDLVRRRTRVATGNVQADRAGLRGTGARTTPGDLLTVVRERPALAVRVPVFLAVTVAGRLRARTAVRRGDFTTWERDASSRT